MDFVGQSTNGFDEESGMYHGTWLDSMNPHPMTMKGKYDEATKTMTLETMGKDPSGQEIQGKSVVVYKDADTRVMTMYAKGEGGEMQKSMELVYTRKK